MAVSTIRILRTLRGWTQRTLAEESGVPPWRIWQLEQGLVQPKPEEARRLWNALTTDDALDEDHG